MQNLKSQNVRGLFDNADTYERPSKTALLSAVLLALSQDLLIGEPTEEKVCDLAKAFFAECHYDKIDEYLATGKFRKIDGVWHIEYESDFRLDNLKGNCVELASKLGTLLQLAFPKRLFMLIEDEKNIGAWNHYAIIDFTKALEKYGLEFDFSECKDLESLYNLKIGLFEKIRNIPTIDDLLIFDPSYSMATIFSDYRNKKSFNITCVDIFERYEGGINEIIVSSDRSRSIPFYKKKIDGLNGFGVSLEFNNSWCYPKFGVLNDGVTEYVDIDQSAFESRLLERAGLDHNDIEYLIESVKKLDIKVES